MEDLKNALERAKDDEYAFKQIYDLTFDRVFHFVLLRTRNREETKEVVQEVYLSFWKSLPKFQYISDGHFWGYLWKVARRQVVKFWRRQSHTISLEDSYDFPADENEREDYRFLLKSMLGLKERERLVLELRYFENLAFGEVAGRLGITESNAKVIHHRALNALKSLLKEEYEDA